MNKGCPRKPIIFIPELYATASKISNIHDPIISCLLGRPKACCNVDTKRPHPDHSQASALLCLKSAQGPQARLAASNRLGYQLKACFLALD